MVERLSRSNLDWDEVSILICKSFFLTDENLLSDVSRDIWSRHHAISRVKENTTLFEVRSTSDSAHELWYDWETKNTNTHKSEGEYQSTNVSFFRTHLHFVSDYQSWFAFEYDTRKNRKRDKNDSRRSPYIEFQIQTHSWQSWSFTIVVLTSSTIWYGKLFCLISVYRSSRNERDVDGDRSRNIVEKCYWYRLRTWYRFWRPRHISLSFLRFSSCQSFRSTSWDPK